MHILLGVISHFLGGFCSGTFYLPYKRVRQWSWESYWIAGGFFSWLIVPLAIATITVPGYPRIIADAPVSTLFWTYVMGLLWGVGGLTFGLTMRFLGLSLGQSIALGLCSSFGALVPPIYRNVAGLGGERLSDMLHSLKGECVLTGMVVCLAGIAVCGRAGILKEHESSIEDRNASVEEFNLPLGLAVAMIAGILSACFNFGIEAGRPIAELAMARGVNPLFQNNAVFVVILWGGFTTNFLWCLALNVRNRSFRDYINLKAPLRMNYGLSALAGSIWFFQFFFYGMGASQLSNGASSWILHMAFIILTANCWGIAIGEWRGVHQRTYATVLVGVTIILFSVCIVGYGNSL